MNRGVSRPTLFSVQLPNRISRQTNDYVNFYCRATAIPEVRSNTVAVAGHEHMGIVREQPTAVMFGKPFTIEVIESSDFRVYKELRGWFNQTAQNSNAGGGNRSQRMSYYNDFVEDMELIKLELSGNQLLSLGFPESNADYKEALRVKFINAFPINIGEVKLSSDAQNQFTTFSVQFAYESYQVTDPQGNIIGRLLDDMGGGAVGDLFGF